MNKIKTIGSREEVFNGLAKKTSGGLEKKDIIKKNKRYISLKKSNEMKKKNPFKKKRLSKKKISFELEQNKTTEFYCKDFKEKNISNNNEEEVFDENEINDNIDFLKLNENNNKTKKEFVIKDIDELDDIELLF